MAKNMALRIVVLALIAGLVMAGCGNPTSENQNNTITPIPADFEISGLAAIYDGSPKEVMVTAIPDKTTGTITVYYTGIEGTNYTQSTTPPSALGKYAVTFNVGAAEGFYAIDDLGAGTLTISETQEFKSGDLSIHFLELGNKYTGDCVYINYGEIDIIIDAGSRQSSATTIKAYIDNYIQDNKLEYVIVTHGHQDHIAGFTGNNGILAAYEIGTIIDFPKTDSTTVIYGNYVSARTAAIAKGAVHYNALQCFRNQNGAQREYVLGDGVKLEILYNYYYENSSNSENDYSVCVRIVQDGKQYIFTGDLEKAGEDRLVSYYASNFGGLGHAVLYKGGHHGSQTSANENLMAAISPEYVCVCTCVGSSEYGANPQNVFPSQVFINRIAPYTDKVYLTTFVPDYENNVIQSMNGNIVFSVSDGNVAIKGSNNNLKLKETVWFLNNRTMPAAWK
jgi:beta-lactamase superfamily II metal-dependent hydrolase